MNSTPGTYFGLDVVVFDSALKLVSEAQYPLLIVVALAVVDVDGDSIPDIVSATATRIARPWVFSSETAAPVFSHPSVTRLRLP